MKYFYLILLVLLSWALGVESSGYMKPFDPNPNWIFFFGTMIIVWIIVLGAKINES